MSVKVWIRNLSSRKRLYRRDALERLANRICEEEGVQGETHVSILFCDNRFIQLLNERYRGVNRATDVLAFPQDNPDHGHPRLLGDIVISLETVERRCARGRARAVARRRYDEVRLLFCHAMLHLLGYEHGTDQERKRMAARQAALLGISVETARPRLRPVAKLSRGRAARKGGTVAFGR